MGIGFQSLTSIMWYRECSRLVDDHGINLADFLKGCGVFDKDVLFCSLTDTHHQGSRCGQSHGTRAGDDQYADSRENGLRQHNSSAKQQPEAEGDQTDAYDCGHENECNLVDCPLNGSFRALCLLYHFDDMGQHGFLSNLLSLETKGALLNDGTSQHLVACTLFYSYRFTRNHRLIDSGRTFTDYDAVYGDALS